MSKPDAPIPPNPYQTAAAQTGTNVSTGVANAFLNNVNQNTPTGSLSFNVSDTYSWTDPSTGDTYNIPRFTATQTLTPDQQQILDQGEQAQMNLANMANVQSQRLGEHLQGNVDLANAPSGGTSDWIGGVPAAATTFGDAGQPTGQFADAGDITRTYGPLDNFSADRSRVEEALYGRLNPQLDRERANIEQRLADQGIRYGSQAYAATMDDYNRQANDARLAVTQAGGAEQQRLNDMAAQRAGFENAAQQQAYEQHLGRGTFYNQAQQSRFSQEALRGQFANAGLAQQTQQQQGRFNAAQAARNQYLQEQYQARNQPINEIAALLGAGQVSMPSFINAPQSQIANTDIAGIINTNFNQNFANYQQANQNWQGLMGGLFGLGGSALRASDERVKENKVPMGSVFAAKPEDDRPIRVPIYEYSYKDDPEHRRHVGPMAQDIERVDPSAVVDIAGVKHIKTRRMGELFGGAHA